MKSKSILGVAGLMLLGACTNDEVVSVKETGAIDFRPLVEASTRATETTVANLKEFKVTALKGGAQWGEMIVTKNDDGTNWTTSPKTYWPNEASAQVDFYAYAPSSAATVTINGTDKKITNYIPSTTVKDQQDLIVAYNTGTMQDNAESGVPMYFKHALSQIEVKAKCESSNMKVEIIGVKIAQVASSGTFTYPTSVTASGTGKELGISLWAAGSDKISYMSKKDAAVTLKAEAQTVSDNFMLIPQTITKWNKTQTLDGSYISVLCRISNVSGDTETQIYPATANKYAFSAVAIGTTEKDKKWEPGKKYVYTLDFFGSNSGGGSYDPDPTIPDGGDDDTVDPTNPEDGGKDIVKPITFTVDVEDWTPVEEVPVNM